MDRLCCSAMVVKQFTPDKMNAFQWINFLASVGVFLLGEEDQSFSSVTVQQHPVCRDFRRKLGEDR